MKLRSVFVSYSGRTLGDKDFAKALLVRVQDQGLEPWIYERRGQEIPAGQPIDEFCRKMIRQADLFIAVISDSSLKSPYCAGEVEFAMQCHGIENIVQVAITQQPASEWPNPYANLTAHKQLRVRADNESDLERLIEDICKRASIPYRVPTRGAPRMPLLARLTEELRGLRPADAEHDVGVFDLLRQDALDITRCYENLQLEAALEAAQGLVRHLEREFGGQPFYYPRLVRGVLEAELGKTRRDFLDKALETFEAVLKDVRLSSRMDENALAGLAAVHMLRGDPAAALDLYRKANALITARGQHDPDLVHNVVLATIAAGAPLTANEAAELTAWKKKALLTQDPYLVERLTALHALASAYLGDYDTSQTAIAALDVSSPRVADILLRVAQELSVQAPGRWQAKADALAEQLFLWALEAAKQPLPDVMYGYGSFLYSRGRFEDALATLSPTLKNADGNPKLLVEAAWCCLQLNRVPQALELCRRASQSRLPERARPVELSEHLYYRGLASWIIGQADLAQRDFLDSGFPRSQSYPRVARNHGFDPDDLEFTSSWASRLLHRLRG
jgi:tetratricopeptide (TPR) repeat protein